MIDSRRSRVGSAKALNTAAASCAESGSSAPAAGEQHPVSSVVVGESSVVMTPIVAHVLTDVDGRRNLRRIDVHRCEKRVGHGGGRAGPRGGARQVRGGGQACGRG